MVLTKPCDRVERCRLYVFLFFTIFGQQWSSFFRFYLPPQLSVRFYICWSKQINLHLVCCGVYQVSFFLMHQRQEILLTLNHLPPQGEFLILITRQPPSHHQAYRKSQWQSKLCTQTENFIQFSTKQISSHGCLENNKEKYEKPHAEIQMKVLWSADKYTFGYVSWDFLHLRPSITNCQTVETRQKWTCLLCS